MENFNGKMELAIWVIFIIIIFTVLEFINGLIVEHMKEIEIITKCTVEGSLPGKMVENMRENIKMIKNMAKVPSNGLMEEATEGSGLMVNSTVEAGIKEVKVMRGMGNGVKEGDING
jgi:hypothetical protein